MWDSDHSVLGGLSATVMVLFWFTYLQRWVSTPSHLQSSCLYCCGSFYLSWWKTSSAHLQAVLIGSCWAHSCNFGVFLGGSQLKVSLLLHFGCTLLASPMAHWIKNPPAMQETQVRSLRQEDPLEEEISLEAGLATPLKNSPEGS